MTALLDAPSDHHSKSGLGGFRIAKEHASDIGKVIAKLQTLGYKPVWLIGTRLGAISTSNAASRLTGDSTPDGLILTAPVTSGRKGGYNAWVAQAVFSVDLENIWVTVLVAAHSEDKCVRIPPESARKTTDETAVELEQTVTVISGPGWFGGTSVKACRGEVPHDFHRRGSGRH